MGEVITTTTTASGKTVLSPHTQSLRQQPVRSANQHKESMNNSQPKVISKKIIESNSMHVYGLQNFAAV